MYFSQLPCSFFLVEDETKYKNFYRSYDGDHVNDDVEDDDDI